MAKRYVIVEINNKSRMINAIDLKKVYYYCKKPCPPLPIYDSKT